MQGPLSWRRAGIPAPVGLTHPRLAMSSTAPARLSRDCQVRPWCFSRVGRPTLPAAHLTPIRHRTGVPPARSAACCRFRSCSSSPWCSAPAWQGRRATVQLLDVVDGVRLQTHPGPHSSSPPDVARCPVTEVPVNLCRPVTACCDTRTVEWSTDSPAMLVHEDGPTKVRKIDLWACSSTSAMQMVTKWLASLTSWRVSNSVPAGCFGHAGRSNQEWTIARYCRAVWSNAECYCMIGRIGLARDGRRRIDEQEDWVRREIATALALGSESFRFLSARRSGAYPSRTISRPTSRISFTCKAARSTRRTSRCPLWGFCRG